MPSHLQAFATGNVQPGQWHGVDYSPTAQGASSGGNWQAILLAYSLGLHQAPREGPKAQSFLVFFPSKVFTWCFHSGVLVLCGLWLEKEKGSFVAFWDSGN